MNFPSRRFPAFGLAFALLLRGGVAVAQVEQPASAGRITLLVENERVRVREVLITSGQAAPVLTSTDAYFHAFRDGGAKAICDGRNEELTFRSGGTHLMQSPIRLLLAIDGNECHGLLIELKRAAPTTTQSDSTTGPANSTRLSARDAGVASPGTTRISFEDDRIRVLENRIGPGGKILEHAHCWPHVAYVATDCRLRFRNSDGTTAERSLAHGAAVWAPPVTHEIENIGGHEAVLLNFEIKDQSAVSPARK